MPARKTVTVPAAKVTPNREEKTLLGKGRYSIYQAANGDGVISYRPDGQDADSHQQVPARVWAVILAALRGELGEVTPAAMLKMMMGMSR